MKKTFFLMMALVPFMVTGQPTKQQDLMLRTGYTVFAEHSGLNLQMQYSISLYPHLDIVVTDILNNTYHRGKPEAGFAFTASDKVHCFSNSILAGLGGNISFAKRCTLRGSVSVGFDLTSSVTNDCNCFQFLDFTSAFSVEFLFKVTDRSAFGLYGTLQTCKRQGGYGDGSPLNKSFGFEMNIAL